MPVTTVRRPLPGPGVDAAAEVEPPRSGGVLHGLGRVMRGKSWKDEVGPEVPREKPASLDTPVADRGTAYETAEPALADAAAEKPKNILQLVKGIPDLLANAEADVAYANQLRQAIPPETLETLADLGLKLNGLFGELTPDVQAEVRTELSKFGRIGDYVTAVMEQVNPEDLGRFVSSVMSDYNTARSALGGAVRIIEAPWKLGAKMTVGVASRALGR